MLNRGICKLRLCIQNWPHYLQVSLTYYSCMNTHPFNPMRCSGEIELIEVRRAGLLSATFAKWSLLILPHLQPGLNYLFSLGSDITRNYWVHLPRNETKLFVYFLSLNPIFQVCPAPIWTQGFCPNFTLTQRLFHPFPLSLSPSPHFFHSKVE